MTDIIVLLAYASLLIELVAYPVPSIGSTLSVLKSPDGEVLTRLDRSRELPLAIKLVRFGLPWALCVTIFLVPIGLIVAPELRGNLEPIGFLDNEIVRSLGLVLVVGGRALTFSSVVMMRGSNARLFCSVRPSELRQHRLFSQSRNPGLVGMFAFFAGLVLVYPSWGLLLGVPVYYAHMHGRVLLEESHLSVRYGSAYQEYQAATRRYL